MPRRLLRDGEIAVDEWRYLGEPTAAADSALILTFDQWASDREQWLERGGRLGVILGAGAQSGVPGARSVAP